MAGGARHRVGRDFREQDMNELGFLWVVVVLAGLALVVAWILLPVALIGTKPLLRKLIEEQQETNHNLRALRDTMRHDGASRDVKRSE